MKITRLGHAAVLIEGSRNIIVDPFLTDNPLAAVKLDSLPNIDIILVTHDHFDHFGDTIAIAKKHDAELVAIHELATSQVVQDANINATGINIGGTYTVDDVSISLTPALHSSLTGAPAGFVVGMDGKNIYHSGDTAVFSDMALISELFGPLDVACIPIGGHFTMDIKGAKKAIELLSPQITIPIHYDTWPHIKTDPHLLVEAVSETSKVIPIEPGKSLSLDA